ncbi:MAG: DUF748 domain-containing protein [Acidobacteriota bacterium]
MHREKPSETSPTTTPRKRRRPVAALKHFGGHVSRHGLQVLAVIGGLILLVIIASFFLDEPIRRQMEKRMNEKLTGYTARIGDLDFNLFGFSITIQDVSIVQDAHPTPPVALIPRLRASVQWTELLTFHLVADFQIDQPQIYVNRTQLQKEDTDEVPVQKKGWQKAAEAIYPLKINLLQVNDASFTYIGDDPKRPLKITHAFLQANNIRNIRSADRVYPSPIHAEGIVFETGRAEIDGHANFLAKPHVGVNSLYTLEEVPLDYFRPMLSRANLSIQNGFLTSHGRVEYAPKFKVAHVEDLTIDRVRIDYIHTARTAAAEERRAEKVQKAVKKASDEPGLIMRLDKFHLKNSNVGFINRVKKPDYRLFLSGANLNVTNLSNQSRQGRAKATLTGRFMGSGRASATASFLTQKSGADFDLDARIEGTQAATMNDVWRAYGKFDVTGGTFSFFTQLRVKDQRIEGYMKPVFADLNVYDPKQDAKKSFFKKVYEKVVEEVGDLLENEKRGEVVTVARISGSTSDPNSNTWQIIGKLIENAFIKAIFPGFEGAIRVGKDAKKK